MLDLTIDSDGYRTRLQGKYQRRVTGHNAYLTVNGRYRGNGNQPLIEVLVRSYNDKIDLVFFFLSHQGVISLYALITSSRPPFMKKHCSGM